MTEHAHSAIAENAVVQSNASHQVREVGAKPIIGGMRVRALEPRTGGGQQQMTVGQHPPLRGAWSTGSSALIPAFV
jgi:hypothetical protein